MQDSGKTDLFRPLLLVALFIVATLTSAGSILGTKIDQAAAQREQVVVANGIHGRINEVAHLIDGQAVWDEAVRHLDNHFDRDWARDNTGTVPCQIDGFEASFILGSDDRLLEAANRNGETPAGFYARFAPSAVSLIRAVRMVEAEHGSALPHARPGQVISKPNVASTLANIDGTIFILSTMAIQPDFGRATLRGLHAPIIVTAMRMDDQFLKLFSERFLLSNARVETREALSSQSAAFVILRNDRGGYVATLDWTPQTPGQALFRRVGPPLLAVLFVLAASSTVLYLRGRRIANTLKISEARATHFAYHDALTGLPNRIMLHDRLADVLRQPRRADDTIAVHCLDLDRFKAINDTYGHHVGDQLMREVARIITAQCAPSDMVARLSGDEFAVIQTHGSATGATLLATRITEAMREPIQLEAGPVFIGCSVGIMIVGESGLSPTEILRCADLALYRSKDTAKGRFCFFEPEMDATIRARRALEADLRVALANGTLHIVYQPQINDRTGMTGVEALMRWKHPEHGHIGPATFIPIAEDCGLIVDLGMFAFRRAFEDSKRWPGLRVAINVSPKQLRMKDFVGKLMELVDEVGVCPSDFELEITEGILLGDDPDTHIMLRQLRDCGFELAFDDFGTGYSGLSYLKRFPINRIKIDRAFVADLGLSESGQAFIIAIMTLASALRIAVIAEGVETVSQYDRLISAGCTDMQGYLFSKPVSANEIDIMRSKKTGLWGSMAPAGLGAAPQPSYAA